MTMQKFEIWQLPAGCPYKFKHFDWIKGEKPTIYDYVLVYDGELSRVDEMETELFLEKLFDIFNEELPSDYHACSMSVSDAIRLFDENGHQEWWYVDGIGFKKLNWR